MIRRILPALATAALACAPAASPAVPTPTRPAFVVKVTSGARENVAVDWAIFPDESWPLEGRRDRTPFELDLPAGRVAAIFRPTTPGRQVEITVFRREQDGSLLRVFRSPSLPIAFVVRDRGDSVPAILGPESERALGQER